METVKRGAMRDEPLLRVGVGAGIGSRQLVIELQKASLRFDTGAYSQVTAELELYPLLVLTRSAVSGLGLRFAYAGSAGLTTPSPVGTESALYRTSISRVWSGLSYRSPHLGSPRGPQLAARVGLAWTGLEVEGSAALPSLARTHLGVGLALEQRIFSFLVPEVFGEYRLPLRVSSPALDAYDFTPVNLATYSAGAALRGRVLAGLGYRFAFALENSLAELPPLGRLSGLSYQDRLLAAEVALTYEL